MIYFILRRGGVLMTNYLFRLVRFFLAFRDARLFLRRDFFLPPDVLCLELSNKYTWFPAWSVNTVLGVPDVVSSDIVMGITTLVSLGSATFILLNEIVISGLRGLARDV